jgi:phospholipase/carboxylesterase
VLRLKDPDGMIVKLVGVDMPGHAPLPQAPIRLRGVTLLTDKAADTSDFIAHFGFGKAARDGATRRMVSDTDIIDIREVSGFVPSVPGAGIPDHVAFRARDVDAVRSMRLSLKQYGPTEVRDRKYFLSLYVRDPAGILIEYATDAPGMTVDEAPADLGRALFLPPNTKERAEDITVMLPQFALPGEERFPQRELPFIHRFHRPEHPDGSTIVLLHGTGGSEVDLMPLARRIAPHATLLSVRGRSTEEGMNRWFRRHDAFSYDQADIRAEAEAFAAFVEGAVNDYGINAHRLVFLGYSNGANLLASVIQLHPGVVKRAVLLRGLQALENPPAVKLAGTHVLMLNGRRDPYARQAPALKTALEAAGAQLTSRDLAAGHELAAADEAEIASWLS